MRNVDVSNLFSSAYFAVKHAPFINHAAWEIYISARPDKAAVPVPEWRMASQISVNHAYVIQCIAVFVVLSHYLLST